MLDCAADELMLRDAFVSQRLRSDSGPNAPNLLTKAREMSVDVSCQLKSDPAEDWVHLCDVAALNGVGGVCAKIPGGVRACGVRSAPDILCDRRHMQARVCIAGRRLPRGVRNRVRPFHAGRFDIRTGAVTGYPRLDPIAVYPAELRGDAVFVRLAARPATP